MKISGYSFSLSFCLSIFILSAGCGGDEVTGIGKKCATNADCAYGLYCAADGTCQQQQQPGVGRMLYAEGGTTVNLLMGEPKTLSVLLTKDNLAVSGETITFAISDPAAAGGSMLNVGTVFTDVNGRAAVTITAGQTPTQFQVVAGDSCTVNCAERIPAQPVSFTVVVSMSQYGILEVALSYPQGDRRLVNFRALLYRGTYACAADPQRPNVAVLEADTPLPGALAIYPDANDPDPNRRVWNSLFTKAVFKNLQSGGGYAVLALGMDQNGDIQAGGCVDKAGASTTIDIQSGVTTSVTAELKDLQFKIKGKYKVANIFNFGDAIPGQVGDIISAITSPFDDQDDPGRYIVELIEQWANLDLDSMWGGIGAAAKTAAIGLVNDLIFEQLPNWGTPGEVIVEVIETMRDLSKFVKDLHINSTIEITSGPDDQGRVNVTERWDEIILEWNGQPTTYPLTAQSGFTHVIQATYSGMLSGGDQNPLLSLDQHSLQFEYGKIFVLYFENVLLPAITRGNAHSVEDALQYLINCENIAQSLDDYDCPQGAPQNDPCHTDGFKFSGFVVFSQDTIESACDSLLGTLATTVENKVSSLINAEMSMLTLYGECKPKDADLNRVVEKLDEGTWSGSVSDATGQMTGPVTGTFTGDRLP